MAHELFAGRYEIGPRLGAGSVGVVYRARDVTTGQWVALKILHAQLAANPAARARFLAEARLAAQLLHPNIVRVLDHGEAADRPYIVMEYLPEPDLRDIIRRYAPLDPDKVAAAGIDCCKALQYAHSRGIVHGDVKPQNILFTTEGVAKLADFGVAAAAEVVQRTTGRVLGTPAYMAPEVAAGGKATPQSDIYSLGCVLYHAVTGRLPFEADSPEQLMRMHIRAKPRRVRELNPSVSPDFEQIIVKAMDKDPMRRYATAAQLQADLEKVRAAQPLGQTGWLPLPQDQAGSQPAAGARVERSPATRPAATAPESTAGPAAPAATAAAVQGARPEPAAAQHAAPMLLPALLLVLAIAVVGVVVWFTKRAFYPGNAPVLVQVPSVKGLSEHEARRKLAAHGLMVGSINYVPHTDAFPEGTVVEQKPDSGTTVKKGTAVALFINRGRELTTVPDVTGMKLEDAERRLRKFHLTIGELERRYDDSVPEGRVIKQGIEPETRVETGAAVDLVVSRGPQPPPQAAAQPSGGETQEGQGAEGQPETEEPAIPPDVTITDLTPDKPVDEPHQYEIRVTALGRKPHQEIEVVAVDASGKRDILLHAFIDPQESKSLKVKLKGPARIEVYHENLNILSQSVPAIESGPSPDVLTAPGGAMSQ